MNRGLWGGVECLNKPPQASLTAGRNDHKVAIPPPLDAVMPLYKRQLTARVISADFVGWARVESFHSVSYGRNNIHKCVLQGDYECDNDAGDVSSRRGISGYFTTGIY